MKKIIALFLIPMLAFSFCTIPVSAADNCGSYGIEYPDDCETEADTIEKVFAAQYGITVNETSAAEQSIVLSICGEASDWSVEYNENSGDVLLTGGSEAALSYAVNKFLETTLITGGNEPCFSAVLNYSYCAATDGTDNSSLLSYKSGDEVTLLPSYSDGLLLTPDWVDSLIMVELRPEMASIGGTLPECKELIDYYASVGVNGIWLPPVYDRGDNGNGYSNYGLNTLEPAITGTDDYEEGWQIVKEFVNYCHTKGIYVFLDIVSWGVVFDSPLIDEHPDWFDGEAWGNVAFNWDNEEFCSWFVNTAVDNILKTGADGYRCDCEPNYAGYGIYGEIRQMLSDEGKNIVIICEDANTRQCVFDFEQDGVLDYSVTDRATQYSDPVNFFGDGYVNIVDSVKKGTGVGYSGWQNNIFKSGTAKYYINCLTNHDYERRDVCGSEINIGYSAILAPYIPLWYMGDEFNVTTEDGIQYFDYIDYSEMNDADNALFLESVKKMINIRRTYSDIFEYWPANHRNGNICKVETTGLGTLHSYARFSGNKAVLVIANNDDSSCGGTVKIPFENCGISGYKSYRITDLTTGNIVLEGSRKDIEEFSTYIGGQRVGIYLVEALGTTYAPNFSFSLLSDRIYTFVLKIITFISDFYSLLSNSVKC